MTRQDWDEQEAYRRDCVKRGLIEDYTPEEFGERLGQIIDDLDLPWTRPFLEQWRLDHPKD